MTPRDKLELIGWSCLSIVGLIVFFSFTRGPAEWLDWASTKFSELRDRLKRKSKKSEPGRHHIVESADGPDVEDDPEVADHSSDDRAHQDDQKEAA